VPHTPRSREVPIFSWLEEKILDWIIFVLMFTWLEKEILEWIVFVFLIILIFACANWRLSFGACDERMSRKD